ncbi:MAG: hypothetical protein PHV37_05670 [Candidatus Gastranaerophilales bacterium]|nr:hypothetical protein [Candidatus Gastranaerophilales bacterium]
MNVSGINNCTPLKPQAFCGNYWEDQEGAKNSISQFKDFMDVVPQQENNAAKNFLSIVGIGLTSAITAGFLAKKGMKLFPAIGESITKTIEKANSKEHVAKKAPKFIQDIAAKINPDGKIAKAIDFAKKGVGDIKKAAFSGYDKFAKFGLGDTAKTTGEVAANGIVNGVAVVSGATAMHSALKDKNENGVADRFEQSAQQAIKAISLADVQDVIG